jgi:prophage tail gpP-like protein
MSSGIGVDHDVVTLTLDDKQTLVIESYDIALAMLTQPAKFTARLGWGGAVKELLDATKAGTVFELRIDGALQFKGRSDGSTSSGRGNGAHEVTMKGRDMLAPLHDEFIDSARSFSDVTYIDLLTETLKILAPGAQYSIVSDETANRRAVTKSTQVQQSSSERIGTTEVFSIVNGTLQSRGSSTGFPGAPRVGTTEVFSIEGGQLVSRGSSTGVQSSTVNQPTQPTGSQRTVQMKIGERMFDGFLMPEFNRAGLVCFALADGSGFALVAPDATQAPIYGISNRRDVQQNVRTEGYEYKSETTTRYSVCHVHFRGGGDGKQSVARAYGEAIDLEMRDVLKIPRTLSRHDHKCKTLAQADFLARRLIAESRRNNWSLSYPTEGHTAIAFDGTRVVWSPNTTVYVIDDEIGLDGVYYIEGVDFSRNPQTMTMLHLMRPEDVLFAEELDG